MMMFAKKDELLLSTMGQIQKLDVGTVDMGVDNPISLTMCSEARAVAVVSNPFLPEGRQTSAVDGGKVTLFDYEDFEKLDEYQLELEERPNCIEQFRVHDSNVLLVGTGYQFPDRSETLSGRILLFSITKRTRKLKLMSSINVSGNTFAVGGVGNYVIACVNAKVISFEVVREEENEEGRKGKVAALSLLQVSEWACAFSAITLRIVGASSKLVIGDALRSIVLLRVKLESGQLEELARDCDPYWTIAAEVLDEEKEVYLGCDIAFNLWTCTRLKWTASAKKQIEKSKMRNLETGMLPTGGGEETEEDPTWSHIMQRDGAYHYGDLVNTVKRGALTAKGGGSGTNAVESKVVFGTAAGAIGLIAKVDDTVGRVLSQLELKLRESFEPIGGIRAEE
jgi:DNA damage-binding protein 1